MINRLKQLRKEYLKLSQTEFGEKLGVSRSVINNLERELVELKEHMIKLICQTFNVNEDWLRNGNEPIFVSPEKNVLENLKNTYNLSDNSMELVELFIKLDEFSQNIVADFMMQLVMKSIENYYTNNPDRLNELYDKINKLPQDKVKLIARGEGVVEVDKDEYDEIIKNAKKLEPEDYDKYF